MILLMNGTFYSNKPKCDRSLNMFLMKAMGTPIIFRINKTKNTFMQLYRIRLLFILFPLLNNIARLNIANNSVPSILHRNAAAEFNERSIMLPIFFFSIYSNIANTANPQKNK